MRKKHSLIGLAVAIFILGSAAALVTDGVVRADFDDETVHLQKLPSSTEVSALTTKSEQPDTILYDNGWVLYYTTIPNLWTVVRFTPTAPFNMLAIYFAVWNPLDNANQGCSLFVVPDDGTGLPDWPNRIFVGYEPPTLANLTWIQHDLAGPMYFPAGQNFYIAYGPAPGGEYPDDPGWWSVWDSDGTTTYRTYLSDDNGQSWDTLTIADALIRAGGWYSEELPQDFHLVGVSGGWAPWTRLLRLEIDSVGNGTYSIMYPADRDTGIYTLLNTFTLDNTQLMSIYNSIMEHGFFSLDTLYEGNAVDGSFCELEIKAEGVTHRVLTSNIEVPAFDSLILDINAVTPGDLNLIYNEMLLPGGPKSPGNGPSPPKSTKRTVVYRILCTIYVDLYIEFSGPCATQALANAWETNIENIWNNGGNHLQYGCCPGCGCPVVFDVITKVRAAGAGPTANYHQVNVPCDTSVSGDSVISHVHTPLPQPNGASGSGDWDNNEPNNTAAHEAGHLMGLGDQYTVVSRNPYRTRTNAGHENDIMATLGGQAQQWAIDQIVQNAGVTCPWWCCCCYWFPIKLVYKLDYQEYEPYFLNYYTDALDELDLEYEINIIPPEYPGPDYWILMDYPVVIWITGNNYYSTILPEDAENLMIYLDNGGNLFITGQDIGYDVWWDWYPEMEMPDPDELPQIFYTDYLHAGFVQDNVGLCGLNGVPESFFDVFTELDIFNDDGANNQTLPDEIDPIYPAFSIATYDTSIACPPSPPDKMTNKHGKGNTASKDPLSSGTGAIAVDNGTYKVVYFAFGFEGINNSTDRVNVMNAVLNWLVPPPAALCTLRVVDAMGTPGTSGNPMDIELNNSRGVGGVEFTLSYDGTLLRADSATTTSRSLHMTFSYSSGPDSLKVLMFSITGDSISTGTGPIVTVFFSVDTSAVVGDSTLVDLKDAVLSDPSANSISVITEDGWFSFRGMKCDVNDDGVINILDIVRMVNIIFGRPPLPTPYELWAADCNDDGAVNIIDIVCCVNRILGTSGTSAKKGHSSAAVEIPEMAVQAGKTNVIPISVDTDVPIAGAQFKLSYDADKLIPGTPQFTERSADMTVAFNAKADELIVLVYSETGKVISSGYGPIVNIPFTVAEDAKGESSLRFDEVILATPDAQLIHVETSRIALKLGQPVPKVYALLQNYPNPCYSKTHIEYQLPQASKVTLKIYNISGQLVNTLVDEYQDAGYYTVRWNGRDELGKSVSSGVYFYQIQAGEFTSIRKLMILR